MATKRQADTITIRWNPVTDNGNVDFSFNNYLLDENSQSTEFIAPGGKRITRESIQEIAMRQLTEAGALTDPITQEPIPALSGAGLMMLIKATVNQIRDELEVQIRIQENPPSHTHSELTASPTSVAADGATEAVLTAQLVDSNDELITWGGYPVRFDTNLGELVGEPVDNGDGTYTQSILSSETGTATVTVLSDEVTLATTSVEFTEVI